MGMFYDTHAAMVTCPLWLRLWHILVHWGDFIHMAYNRQLCVCVWGGGGVRRGGGERERKRERERERERQTDREEGGLVKMTFFYWKGNSASNILPKNPSRLVATAVCAWGGLR